MTYGTVPDQRAILPVNFDDSHPHDVAMVHQRSGVALRTGHLGASPLMSRYGIDAICHARFRLDNTRSEINAVNAGFVTTLLGTARFVSPK